VLMRLKTSTGEECKRDIATTVLDAIDEFLKQQARMVTFDYGGDARVIVCEGAVDAGLGSRVWLAAQVLARCLVSAPQIVQGAEVLELGSGIGLVGLLAHRLGANRVVLTDNEVKVLSCLRRSAAATAALQRHGQDEQNALQQCSNPPEHWQQQQQQQQPLSPPQQQQQQQHHQQQQQQYHEHQHSSEQHYRRSPPQQQQQQQQQRAQQRQQSAVGDPVGESGSGEPEELEWDPEDADTCSEDDFDGSVGWTPPVSKSTQWMGGHMNELPWEQESVQVRRLDWVEDMAATGPPPDSDGDRCPDLPAGDTYKIVVASDVVYEEAAVQALAGVLASRLAPTGRALICCPIREQVLFDSFLNHLEQQNLRHEVQGVQPLHEDAGVSAQVTDYEGGFKLVAVQHAEAPPYDWPWEAMTAWQQDGKR